VDEQLTPGVVVVLEPTGGYELGLAGFAAAQGRRAKPDRQDARILARYGAAQPLAAWTPTASELVATPR
jgi:transposase